MSSVSSGFRPILKLPVRQCRVFLVVSFGTDWQGRLTAVRQVRQQQNRYNKSGVNNRTFAKRWLKGFYRPDRPKKAGAIAHPEAQTFDCKRMDGESGDRKSRLMRCKTTCPLYPRKRIFSAIAGVRFGPKADMYGAREHVPFTPKSGHVQWASSCLLWANNGHLRFDHAAVFEGRLWGTFLSAISCSN